MEESSRWVPIREAARILDVSIDTIRRWDEKGIIHSNRLKGRNRYIRRGRTGKPESHPAPFYFRGGEKAGSFCFDTAPLGTIRPNNARARGERRAALY